MTYKLETHLHTKGNSPCGKADIREIIEIYKEAGYNGIVCTNHFNSYIMNTYFAGLSDEEKISRFFKAFYELKEEGAKHNIDVFFGLELALKNDYYNKQSKLFCAELLVYGITCQEFLEDTIKLYNMSYKEFFHYADKKGWLVVQAHPYRLRSKRISYKYLHGIEAFNGHPYHKSFNSLALFRANRYKLIKTAGSDFHFRGGATSGIILEEKVKNEKHLVELLKMGKYTII